jgi:hypothetical protein
MSDLTEEQEKVFLEKNKEILKILLENCRGAVEKSDLDTFKKMIVEKRIFNCIMAAPGFSYQCSLKIELIPKSEKKEKILNNDF